MGNTGTKWERKLLHPFPFLVASPHLLRNPLPRYSQAWGFPSLNRGPSMCPEDCVQKPWGVGQGARPAAGTGPHSRKRSLRHRDLPSAPLPVPDRNASVTADLRKKSKGSDISPIRGTQVSLQTCLSPSPPQDVRWAVKHEQCPKKKVGILHEHTDTGLGCLSCHQHM